MMNDYPEEKTMCKYCGWTGLEGRDICEDCKQSKDALQHRLEKLLSEHGKSWAYESYYVKWELEKIIKDLKDN